VREDGAARCGRDSFEMAEAVLPSNGVEPPHFVPGGDARRPGKGGARMDRPGVNGSRGASARARVRSGGSPKGREIRVRPRMAVASLPRRNSIRILWASKFGPSSRVLNAARGLARMLP
jgi:hypothetical protein